MEVHDYRGRHYDINDFEQCRKEDGQGVTIMEPSDMTWKVHFNDSLRTCLIDLPDRESRPYEYPNILLIGKYDSFETCELQASTIALQNRKSFYPNYFFWSPFEYAAGKRAGGNCYVFRSINRIKQRRTYQRVKFV